MVKLLQAATFISLMILSGLAVLAPFIDPRWFCFSLPWCVVIMAYGKQMSLWAGKFMEDDL